MREYLLDIPTIIIAICIYIIISKLTISAFLLKKEIILILLLIEIIGLIYDGIIILLGFSMSDNVLRFFNRLRFIFHGLLVPLLVVFCGYALNLSEMKFYINLIIAVILSILGVILGIIANLEINEGELIKRCTFSKDDSRTVKMLFTLMNIGCVIYMIVVGIILYVKNKDYLFFLSGFFMFVFSAIGPATGNSDLNYLLSMYGEVLMIIFLYLFFRKKEHLKNKQIEDEDENKIN